jgi:integrase
MASASQRRIRVPSLRLHRASGLAVVTIRGRDIYCGAFGSPEADSHYRRVIADLVASGPEVVRHHGLPRPGGRQPAFSKPAATTISVSELLLAYIEYAEGIYLPPSRETEIIKRACRTVRELFGEIPAIDFGARQLKAVRQHLIDKGNTRTYINAQVSRIVRIWGWGAEEDLIPASAWHALTCVKGLRAGRSAAKEPKPNKNVPEADFQAALAGLSSPVRAITELLWWTAARSGEIRKLRTRDIDRSSIPWRYSPLRHKTACKGHERAIFFGPRARAILQPFLDEANPDKYLFSPADATRARQTAEKVAHRSDARRAAAAAAKRRLDAKKRLDKTGKAPPKSSRRPGTRYTRNSLANALRRRCARIGVEYFKPHRLRHTARCRLEALVGKAAADSVAGIEYASDETQATLGHASARMTKRYGGICYSLAADTMERHG